MSRSALDGYPLCDVEKDYVVKFFKKLGRLYFVEIIGYSVLGNHFHLLVKMLPESDFSDARIKQRFGTYFGEKRFLSDEQIPFFREKYGSLSEFIKQIDAKTVAKERKRGFRITSAERFKQRTCYFTDSGIIGSREFVRENFLRFKHLFQTKPNTFFNSLHTAV